ncbi:MAG: peptidoglycan bridge formation glycyltransferase FemA/FemB family protein, partial [bacterium]|nr:peptidoglycan bridge formation glycyltransferase FemA/FemB family protein [bacterium]
MKFLKLESSLKEEWDKIVQNSDDAWIFHLYDWITMIERIPEWNLKPENFLVEHEGEIVAIFPLQMRRHTRGLLSTGMGAGGHAIRNNVESNVKDNIKKAMYKHIEEIAYKNNSPYITISLPPLSKFSLNNQWGVNPLINYLYSDTSTHTWMIDLSFTEDILWNNLSYNAIRKIKLAKEMGYSVKKIQTLEEMEKYYEIHCETYRRTGVRPHPEEYFLGIYEKMVSKNISVIWAGISPQGEMVAFKNIGCFGEGTLFWTGCCKTDHLKNGINYLLTWHSICWSKEQGYRWFESGEAFPNIREGKLKGLNDFKSKFGGELYRFYKGTMFLISKDKPENKPEKWEALKGWVKYTKLLIRKMSGKRILRFGIWLFKKPYRHIKFLRSKKLYYPKVSFIKPYWGVKEFQCGTSYRDVEHPATVVMENDNSVEILIKKFRDKLNMKGTIIPTSSGRIGLELALRVLKSKYPKRNKVVIPTYGCKGTFDPVIKAGLSPILVDIGKDLNIAPSAVKDCLDAEVLAMLIPHLCGCKAETESLAKMAKEKDIIVIEDVCQGMGGKDSTGFWGTQYDMAIFSFGMGKNLMATAGGILVSNILEKEILEESKNLSNEDTKIVEKRFKNIVERYF